MASSRVSPATKRRAMPRVVPLEVTHLAKPGLSESLRSVARSMQYDYARGRACRLVGVPIQELFRVQGGHAAGAGGRDGLSVAVSCTSPATNTPGMAVRLPCFAMR